MCFVLHRRSRVGLNRLGFRFGRVLREMGPKTCTFLLEISERYFLKHNQHHLAGDTMQKRSFALGCVLVCGLTLLTSCTVYTPQGFKPDPSQPIRTIALLTMESPPVYELVFARRFQHQTIIGGVNITALKGIGENIDKKQAPGKFNDRLRSHRFSMAESLTYYIFQKLTEAGYNVITMYVDRGFGGFNSDYTKLRSGGADAFLDVSPGKVGYREYDTGWEPHAEVQVRLVSTRTRSVRYDRVVSFKRKQEDQSLWPNEKYRFIDHNQLMTNMPLTIEGLHTGSQAIAAHLVTQFRQ